MATPPTLTTQVTADNYRSEIDANFDAIQTSLRQICNELPQMVAAGIQATNMSWVERAIRPNGIGGALSFVPVLDTDSRTMRITHPGQDGWSWALISGLFHYSTTELSRDLTTIATNNGTYECVIGLKTLGAPALEIVVDEDETDTDYDLLLYTFNLHRQSGVLWVTDLRMVANLLFDRYTWDQELASHVVQTHIDGALPGSVGGTGRGFIAPFDLQISQADFYLATGPSAVTVEAQLVRVGNATDGNILASTATWTAGQSGARSVAAATPAVIIPAQEFVEIDMVQTSATASNLSCAVTFKRIYHAL